MAFITSIFGGNLRTLWSKLSLCILCLYCGTAITRSAESDLQFDVFLGYDGYIREAGWFPVTCEVFNPGPSFNAIIEITPGDYRSEQVRVIPVELPTNTRKRLIIPVFASGGRAFQRSARLLDERGRVQAERARLQAKTVSWEGVLLGALPRTYAGMPVFPDVRSNRPELKPQIARVQAEQVPDNPIAFESLNAFYLNSEKALSLSVNQAAALLAWLHGGGHLIVSVEQLADVAATPWLLQVLPCKLIDFLNVRVDESLHGWLRRDDNSGQGIKATLVVPQKRPMSSSGSANLALDPAFDKAEMPVATVKVTDGRVVLSADKDNKPLIIEAVRGRGTLTLLTFNPEREPFRSWKNRPWFWSKLLGVPESWYFNQDTPSYGGLSIDGVFGALIDSRQVQKLPVKWLLLLLVVYLAVIGPFDQYWLKKINRQMLTWITFPAYVVFFSLLIYFIGYRLRAGETEWNELHIVDILPRGGTRAELRGRTYSSIYSSASSDYKLAFTPPSQDSTEQTFASFRPELLDLYGVGREGNRAEIEQRGNSFRAQISVPVWTSLLYVNDWMQSSSLPFHVSAVRQGNHWAVTVENLLGRPLTDARIVLKENIYDLGTLPPGSKKDFKLEDGQGTPLSVFVQQNGTEYVNKVESRRQALGETRRGQLDNPSLHSVVCSFSSYVPSQHHQRGFVAPAGLDLTPVAARGDAILLAWDADHSFINPINQFQPPRSQKNSLLRLAFPIGDQLNRK